jgi:hypothetical protein
MLIVPVILAAIMITWILRTSRVGSSSQTPSNQAPRPSNQLSVSAEAPKSSKALLSADPVSSLANSQTRLHRILSCYLSDPMFSQDFFGFPMGDYPPFWKLVAEIKAELGEAAAPTLVALIREAKSASFKRAYAGLLIGLKDPAAEHLITGLAQDLTQEPQIRGFAVYGLGLLKTESAWQAILSLKAKGPREPYVPYAIYCALAQFGDRAVDMLVSEASAEANSKGAGLAAHVLHLMEVSGDTLDRLLQHPVPKVRQCFYVVMGRQLTPEGIPRFLDNAVRETDEHTRSLALLQLQLALRNERLELTGSPDTLAHVRSNFDRCPAEIQTALLLRPEIRAEFPGRLEELLSRSDIVRHPYASINLVYALVADPSTHSLLARQLKEDWYGMSLYMTKEAMEKRGGFTDPTLAAALADVAIDPQATKKHYGAWGMLAIGPREARTRALERVPQVFAELSNEADRAQYADILRVAGPEAVPTMLNLLTREEAVGVSIELATGVLALARTGAIPSGRIVEELGRFFRPGNDIGLRYIMNHPHGFQNGLEEWSRAIRDYYGQHAGPQQITELTQYVENLNIPAELAADPRKLESVRKHLHEAALQCIDVLRIRHPDTR